MTSTQAPDLQDLLAEEPFVRALARGLLFDENQVDEVVQQTWVRAWRRPPAGAGVRGWLAAVVRNVVRNERRADRRRAHREQSAAVAEALPSAEEMLAREDLRRRVVEAVAGLREPFRTTILLRYFEHLPPRRIAAELDASVETVKSRLKRGLAMLREVLDEHHGGDGRAWRLALVPMAAPARTGALVVPMLSFFGVLWTMKGILFGAVVAVALVWFGVTAWGGDAESPGVETATVPAVVGAPVESGLEAESAAAAEPVARSVVAAAGRVESPSVLAALCGFRGRLIKPDGTPAPGHIVRILTIDPVRAFGSVGDPLGELGPSAGMVTTEVVSDRDGRFVVEGLWPRTFHALHAGVFADDGLLRVLGQSPGPGEVADLGDVALQPRGRIIGRVVDADGDAVAGAEVWAADLPGAVLAAAPVDRLVPDGGLMLALPALGSAEPGPDVDPAAYHSRLRDLLGQRTPVAESDTDYAVLDLPPWAQRFLTDLPIARTVSGADGAFTLRGVDPGPNVLVVRSRGFESGGRTRVLVKPGATRDVGAVRLGDGETLIGQVVDAEGAGIADALVRVAVRPAIGMTGVLFSDPEVRADAEGRFEIPGLPRGDVVVAARGRAGDPWTVAGAFDSGDDIAVELAIGPPLTLQLASAGGAPLEDVELELLHGPPLGELALAGMARPIPLEGRLELLASEATKRQYRLVGLVPGFYTLFVRATGHAMTATPLRAGSADAEVEVELPAAAELPIHVVDSNGRPVHGARVFAQCVEQPVWARTLLHAYGEIGGWTELASDCGRTDRDGRALVTDLPAGSVRLTVRHPAFGITTAEVTLPAEPARVVLREPGAIRGALFDGGRPASPSEWRLSVSPASTDYDTGAPSPRHQVAVRADGTFEVTGLAPGRWVVNSRPALAPAETLGSLLKRTTGIVLLFESHGYVEVDVAAGETVEVRFDVDPRRLAPGQAGSTLTGTVTIDGAAADGFLVNRGLFSARFGKVDGAGRFEATGLRPKSLDLHLQGQRFGVAGTWWSRRVEVRSTTPCRSTSRFAPRVSAVASPRRAASRSRINPSTSPVRPRARSSR